MIRYPRALDDIEGAIDRQSPTWRARAEERTALFARLGGYAESYRDETTGKERTAAPFWSTVKPVYLKRQHRKCIFCETRLEAGGKALVQWDLEHFRPKRNVREWPGEPDYDFNTGAAAPDGYYLLAYHPENYAASCKPCNSTYKSDFFPVAAARIAGGQNPSDYQAEEAFLVYPLGVDDEDPEDLITFEGVQAIPKHGRQADLRKWRRARVIIAFFGLNRDGLQALRAYSLVDTWSQVVAARAGAAASCRALARKQTETGEFCSCTRRFLELCERDFAAAGALVVEFEKIIEIWEER